VFVWQSKFKLCFFKSGLLADAAGGGGKGDEYLPLFKTQKLMGKGQIVPLKIIYVTTNYSPKQDFHPLLSPPPPSPHKQTKRVEKVLFTNNLINIIIIIDLNNFYFVSCKSYANKNLN